METQKMNADVIVIGAGIVGCSAAFHLAEAGISTLVLEKGEISGEASGVNMGGLGGTGWGKSPSLQAFCHLAHVAPAARGRTHRAL